MDEIEAKFVRRLKTMSGKYQGKLPFKCFNYGKVGHFATKCPHKKKERNSADERFPKIKYNKENKYKKKSLCVNDVDSIETSNSESSHENKENEFMLMAIEDLELNFTENDMNDEDAIVDMEGELMNALEEIDRLRIKKRTKTVVNSI